MVGRSHRVTAAGLGLLALVGCSDSAAPGEVPATSVSTAQAAEIVDGTVTQDEYDQAYRRYLACMSDAGYGVTELGTERGVYQYAYPEVGSQADAECYASEFEQVDIAWQIAHEGDSAATDALRACLREHGIEPAESVAEMAEQMTEASLTPADCE